MGASVTVRVGPSVKWKYMHDAVMIVNVQSVCFC